MDLPEAKVSKPTLIAAAITAFVAAGAQAQTAPAATAPKAALDRAGLVKQIDENFSQVDVNNDNFLSREEMNAAGAKAMAKAQENVEVKLQEEFTKLDADKNGQLNFAEFKSAAKVRPKTSPDEALTRLDSNKDGKLSEAEFKNRALAEFDALDLNKDGKITPDEQSKARSR